MTNPFEDDDASYFVLVNHEGQHSLWPESIAVPEGWQKAHGPDVRARCIDHINRSWTDLRPASLIATMDGDVAGNKPSR